MQGLTTEQVLQRHAEGQWNYAKTATSRPFLEILRANIFTVFNGVLTAAVIAVLLVGDWRDAVFGFVMVFNSAIGVFSELRAKAVLNSVAVLDVPKTTVWRDGVLQEIDSADLVCDDIVELTLGDQIPADGEVVTSQGLEVDESALTGESRPVYKNPGDSLLSGTYVVAGSGTMIVQKIGMDAWAQQVTAEAKKFSLAVSEIQQAVNKIIKWITWIIPFLVVLLYVSQTQAGHVDPKRALVGAVAGVVGFIPQGLVLLTSLNFGIAAARLAKRGVLVQELPAVEILARVDQLCLDKTGTITTGGIRGKAFEVAPSREDKEDALFLVLDRLTQDETNASATAIQEMLRRRGLSVGSVCEVETDTLEIIPFSSRRGWSALRCDHGGWAKGTWVFGAPEIILAQSADSEEKTWATKAFEAAARQGNRVISLAHSPAHIEEDEPLPAGLTPVLLAVMEEDIRPDAAQTFEYFRDQDVGVRIISGDSVGTVSAIAAQAGLTPTEGTEIVAVDGRELPAADQAEFDEIVARTQVFGRITPEQKRHIVQSLQQRGHTVAMTGDGVNDALALKEADLGIAMGNGAPATKAVSRIVLLNGQFAVLPGVVAEGRRIIANMERVSSLFLSKTTYALLIAIIVVAFGWTYPFLPRQLTYISSFTIGIPAFFLALGQTNQRYRPGFLRRTLITAVPAGIIIGAAALGAYASVGEGDIEGQTAATLSLILVALWFLGLVARPINARRAGLLLSMAALAVAGVIVGPVRFFFALDWPTADQWWIILAYGVLGGMLVEAISWAMEGLGTPRWSGPESKKK